MGEMQKLCTLFKRISSGSTTSRAFSVSFRARAPIEVGDKLPSAVLSENTPDKEINTCDLVANKKLVIFGVPGAFGPGSSKTHLAGYVAEAGCIKAKLGLDEIVCVSVNDPYVMAAWGKEQRADGKVRMLADPNGCFAKALDLTIYLPQFGGLRMMRFSMVVDKGEVKELNVEPDGIGLTCSLVSNIGKQ